MASNLRLLPLLLFLLLPAGLRELLSPSTINRLPGDDDDAVPGDDEVLLHPLVLVPGLTCSELEARLTDAYSPSVPRCGAMKGKGWFGLWTNTSDLSAHDYVDCFMEQMTLVYDSAANDYRNLPGVETRVRGFGSSRSFHYSPENPTWCFHVFTTELEGVGYRDGNTLFGAPYDLRHAPPIPGQTSEVFSLYFRQLTGLVEDASRKNGNKKVILLGHSYGGAVALEFLRSTTVAWRDAYIKHLFLVAPVTSEGIVESLQGFVSGTDLLSIPTATALQLRPMWRSFESSMDNFPSPAVFGDDRPLVVTARRNYSAHDVEDLLVDIGYSAGVEPFRRRAVPRINYFKAPMVPTTCINGVGNDTPEQLVFPDGGGDFDAEPEIVYGDGDKSVNLISMLAFDEKMRQHPAQNMMFKSVMLHGAQHGTLLTEDWALKRVMQEILEANSV